jgi:plasmid stability protein
MGEIRIKIEDESLLVRLSALAVEHNRSIDQEIEELLLAALPTRPRREDLPAIARQISAMTPKGVKQTDSVEILRELRGN